MRIHSILPCALLILAPACGGDDEDDKGGGGTGTVDSGVDGSKPLSMLTDAEAQKIAQSYASASATDKLLDGVCKSLAVFTAALGGGDPSAQPGAAPTAEQVMACNDAYEMCKMQVQQAQGQPAAAPADGMEVPTTASAFAGCEVTVDQYEACLTAQIRMLEEFYSGLSCDEPLTADATAAPTATLSECEAFSQCAAGATAE